MNKDQLKGRLTQAGGKAQKEVGKALDSPAQEGKGLAREQKGKAQKTWGDAKDTVREAGKDITPRGSSNRRGTS